MSGKKILLGIIGVPVGLFILLIVITLIFGERQFVSEENVLHDSSSGEVPVSIIYYDVEGNTVQQLQNSIAGHDWGVVPAHGTGTARVVWDYDVSHRLREEAGSCRYVEVKLNGSIVEELPRWQAPAGADSALVARWNTFITNLETHEQEHVDLGLQAAKEIHDTLINFPPQPTCDELTAKGDARTDEIYDKYEQRNIEYDKRTNHGVTQGAAL